MAAVGDLAPDGAGAQDRPEWSDTVDRSSVAAGALLALSSRSPQVVYEVVKWGNVEVTVMAYPVPSLGLPAGARRQRTVLR